MPILTFAPSLSAPPLGYDGAMDENNSGGTPLIVLIALTALGTLFVAFGVSLFIMGLLEPTSKLRHPGPNIGLGILVACAVVAYFLLRAWMPRLRNK